MSENKKLVEIHGCIVCAKIFNILAVYDSDSKLVDCTVTSPGGHRVLDARRPLVACNTHSASEVEIAYKKWQSASGKGLEHEKEEE